MTCKYYKNSYVCRENPCEEINPKCSIVIQEKQKENIYSISKELNEKSD